MPDICRSCLPGGFCCGEEGDDFGFSAEWLKCTALVTPEEKLVVWCHGQSSSVCNRSSFLQVWSLKISPRWRHPATLREPAMGKCSGSRQDPWKVTGGAGKAGWQDGCTQISCFFFPSIEWAAPRGLLHPSFLPSEMLWLDITFPPGARTQVSPHLMWSEGRSEAQKIPRGTQMSMHGVGKRPFHRWSSFWRTPKYVLLPQCAEGGILPGTRKQQRHKLSRYGKQITASLYFHVWNLNLTPP